MEKSHISCKETRTVESTTWGKIFLLDAFFVNLAQKLRRQLKQLTRFSAINGNKIQHNASMCLFSFFRKWFLPNFATGDFWQISMQSIAKFISKTKFVTEDQSQKR